MAEAPDLPKTLEELEKEITCSVCLGHYREPKILPCFHYYCICRDCIIYKHIDHDHKFVRESAPQCREKLRESLAPLQQVQAKITAAVLTIQTAKREVAENHATVSDTINQSINQLIAILQQRKKDLLAKASQLAQEKLGALNAQEKSLNMSLAEAQSMVDFLERSLENATDEELLEMQQQIVTGVEESCKKQQQADLQPAAKANIFTNMSCGQKTLCAIGSVGLGEIDLTKYRAEINEAKVNKLAQFTLYLVDSASHLYKGLPSIVAEVKSLVDGSVVPAAIAPVHNGAYNAAYTPRVRGRHYITVRVNGREMTGSPFSLFVRIPPAQLQKPVRRINGVKNPYGVAISDNDELLVAEYKGARVSVFDKLGRKLQEIQHKDLPHPCGVAVDPGGNIYVCNTGYKIVKFDKDGHVLKATRSDSDDLFFMRVIGGMLFVCCGDSHRVSVYDCNTLQLIISFGKKGEGNGKFDGPCDVLSVNGEVYVSDCSNCRIQVFNQKGLNFVRSFKVKNPTTQRLCAPCGICVSPDRLLYVACNNPSCVLVFTLRGEFVASLGEVTHPRGIAVDSDGFVYVTCWDFWSDCLVF